jgi:hypothetical protein
MAKRDQLLALYELADRKGYDVTQSTMRDHVPLVVGQRACEEQGWDGAISGQSISCSSEDDDLKADTRYPC